MLRDVLECSDIFDSEEHAFSDMLDRLENNLQKELTERQREWVQKTADRVGVFVGDYQNLVSSGQVKPNPNAPKFPFETMPRPLKPPGRR